MRQILILTVLLTMGLALAQDPPSQPGKPRLIRDDQTQTIEEEVILPDPNQARENVRVGDFYFKRKNYKAAADRYADATRYGPTWMEAYDKLAVAYELLKEFDKAIQVCRQFIEITSDPEESRKFNERLEKLAKKAAANEKFR